MGVVGGVGEVGCKGGEAGVGAGIGAGAGAGEPQLVRIDKIQIIRIVNEASIFISRKIVFPI